MYCRLMMPCIIVYSTKICIFFIEIHQVKFLDMFYLLTKTLALSTMEYKCIYLNMQQCVSCTPNS